MTVAGLLLAAGAGTRFGRPKALVEFDGQLLVDRGVQLLRGGGCAPVHVVLGAAEQEVLERAAMDGAVVVSNTRWESGMASSLRVGLESMPDDVHAAVVALVDQPLVGVRAVERLIAARERGALIAVATYHGARRNPVLLDRSVWPGVIAASRGDVGARAYLVAHPDEVYEVECADVSSAADVDTESDLDALRRQGSG